jgi:hypothetical protein
MVPASRKRRRPVQVYLKGEWDTGNQQEIFHCGPCSRYGYTTKGGKVKHFNSESCRQNHAQGDTSAPLVSSFVTNSANSASALASNPVNEEEPPVAKRQRK